MRKFDAIRTQREEEKKTDNKPVHTFQILFSDNSIMDTMSRRRRQKGDPCNCLRPLIRLWGITTAIGKL